MDEVFDYCIWQAHVDGHITLDGKPARTSPALILDILTRAYLEAMLQPGKLDAFSAWRTAKYRSDVPIVPIRRPLPFLLAVRKMLRILFQQSKSRATVGEMKLSSQEYQDLDRFCKLFKQRFGLQWAERVEEVS